MSLSTTHLVLQATTVLVCFVCSLLAAFLFAAPSDRRAANLYLGGFLGLTAIDMAGWLSPSLGLPWAWMEVVRLDLAYGQMPLFTAFVLATLYKDFRPGRWAWLHFLPIALALVLGLPGSQLAIVPGVAEGGVAAGLLTEAEIVATVAGLHIQYYAYIAVAAWVLFRFARLHRQQYSGPLPSVFPVLLQLVVLSVLLHTLVLVRSFVGFGGQSVLFGMLAVVGAVLVLGVLTWLTLIALLHPDMFRRVDRSFEVARRERSMRTPAEEALTERRRLEDHMETEQPYLDPDISLAGLARGLGITPRELSGLINQAFGVHFFDFVNRYRIEAAKTLLLATPRMSVIETAYASGFNSKSSFNAAFRRHAGTSPTEFRKIRAGDETAV